MTDLCALQLFCGRPQQALETARQNLDLQLSQDQFLECDLGNIGRTGAVASQALLILGQVEEAQDLVQNLWGLLAKQPELLSSQRGLGYLSPVQMSLLRREGRIDEAILLADRQIDLLSRSSLIEPPIVAELFDSRAILFWAKGEYSRALQDLQTELNSFIPPGDVLGMASATANQGLIYTVTSQFDYAEKCLRQAIKLSEQINAHQMLMRQVAPLGFVCLLKGDLVESLTYIEYHLRLAEQAGDQDEIDLATSNRGGVLTYLGDYVHALPDLTISISRFESKNRLEVLVGSLVDLSVCYWGMDKHQLGKETAEKAFMIAQEKNFLALKIISQRCLAQFECSDTARDLLIQALEQARLLNRKLDIAGCLFALIPLSSDQSEIQQLWYQGETVLTEIGATAWLRGRSIQDPPKITMST